MKRSIKVQKGKGFTLIELIVVLAVLAIIMAIAVPRFGGVREEAKLDSDMATLASIAKLAEFEFIKMEKVDGEAKLDYSPDSDLIGKNFSDPDNIFQSENLKKYESIEVAFSGGKVDTITVDGAEYTYSGGKFLPSDGTGDQDDGDGED